MISTKECPPAQELHKLITYCPDTGLFTWNPREGRALFNVKFSGKVAGKVVNKRYVQLSLLGKRYMAHRIAWVMIHGRVDKNIEVDHINHNGLDNRICNLRLATRHQNNCNSRIRHNNKTGFKGVTLVYDGVRVKGYRADIQAHKKSVRLGYFNSPEEAHQAYCKASLELHKEFSHV